jgi:hypothetical protein
MNQPLKQSKMTPPVSNPQTLKVPLPGVAGTYRPAHAEIAKRAYEIYRKRGRQQGHCERNWLQAEQELTKEAVAQSKPSGGRPTVTHSPSSGSR